MARSLRHWGILGMHWGITKDQNSPSSSKNKSTKGSGGVPASSVHPDHSHLRELQKKKISEMSNNDIRAMAERINLEQTHRKLTQSQLEKGAIAAAGILTGIGATLFRVEAEKFIKQQYSVFAAEIAARAAKSAAAKAAAEGIVGALT